ncbi:MAG: serine hydrolase domain-containing protein [Pseudomonadota bacterium]
MKNLKNKEKRISGTKLMTISIIAFGSFICSVNLQAQSSFGSGFDEQDFYKPFSINDITPENMQHWPYYKYASVHWDEYGIHGTEKIPHSKSPAKISVAEGDNRLDLNTEWKDGKSYMESFVGTQVKAFVVMKDNEILAEFYDNGFTLDDTQLLQSASKSFAGVIVGRLVDQGLINTNIKLEEYLTDFKGTDLGNAKVQDILDMLSGLPALLDYHTPGADGQKFEVEIGLQPGKATGHRNYIKAAKAESKPGESYKYSDINTDALALLCEKVSGKKYSQLLSELFNDIGANSDGSIALSSDGTASANYGISMSARDYALFHQWIAKGKAPKSYYKSATDISKTKFGEDETGKLFGGGITYGSQSYYMAEHNVLYSQGSYGQQGFSDLSTGVSVIFLQDWAVNAEMDKLLGSREKALAIIMYLRAQSSDLQGY